MVTAKGYYGLLALVELASRQEEKAVPVKALALELRLPESFLENVFSLLKSAGWVKGARGPGGGYRLVADPEHLTVLAVVTALDGMPDPASGLQGSTGGHPAEAVLLERVFKPLEDQLRMALEGITLQQLSESRKRLSEPMMYYI